jgi:hypothetical protein
MQKMYLECSNCDAKSVSFLTHCTDAEASHVSAAKSCSHYKKGQTYRRDEIKV